MPLPAWLVALAGLLVVTFAWLHYLASIPREKVPPRPGGHLVVFALGSLLGLLSVGLSVPGGAWAVPLVLAVVAVGLAMFFVYLLRQAPLPDGRLAVSVGDPLPLIEAPAQDGRVRRSADLAGQRLLIKFFRGHW